MKYQLVQIQWKVVFISLLSSLNNVLDLILFMPFGNWDNTTCENFSDMTSKTAIHHRDAVLEKNMKLKTMVFSDQNLQS